jgi:hypothetical protein
MIQGWVELAGGRVEDGLGDPAKVGVLAVEHAERVVGLVGLMNTISMSPTWESWRLPLSSKTSAETSQASGSVSAGEPPALPVLVGEVDPPRIGGRVRLEVLAMRVASLSMMASGNWCWASAHPSAGSRGLDRPTAGRRSGMPR